MINHKFRMEGYFSFKVGNDKTGEERDITDIVANDTRNLILDSGLDAIGTTSICGGCKVGTGNTPASSEQVDLISPLAITTTIQAQATGRFATPPYYMWGRRTFRFAQGAAAGNLTEVGTYGSSASSLFSRALIVDTEGNPTVLTILEDEWLDVTYELRVYQDLNDKSFSLVLDGVTYSILARPSQVTSNTATDASYFFSHFFYWNWGYDQSVNYNGTIGTITGQPTGTGSESWNVSTTYGPYTLGTFERECILSSGLNDSNLSGGISATLIRTHKAYWQFGFTPPIPKDMYRTLVLNITISWSRYDP